MERGRREKEASVYFFTSTSKKESERERFDVGNRQIDSIDGARDPDRHGWKNWRL